MEQTVVFHRQGIAAAMLVCNIVIGCLFVFYYFASIFVFAMQVIPDKDTLFSHS